MADPLVDEQRRNLSAFVRAFAEDESRYERGERMMLEMMTEMLEQLGPAGLETSLKLVAFNSNSFRQSEENWPALTTVKGTTIRFHYVIPKEVDSMAEWLAPPEDPAPDAAALMHEFMCNRPLTRLALENGATILIARYTDLGEALPEIETNLARCLYEIERTLRYRIPVPSHFRTARGFGLMTDADSARIEAAIRAARSPQTRRAYVTQWSAWAS